MLGGQTTYRIVLDMFSILARLPLSWAKIGSIVFRGGQKTFLFWDFAGFSWKIASGQERGDERGWARALFPDLQHLCRVNFWICVNGGLERGWNERQTGGRFPFVPDGASSVGFAS